MSVLTPVLVGVLFWCVIMLTSQVALAASDAVNERRARPSCGRVGVMTDAQRYVFTAVVIGCVMVVSYPWWDAHRLVFPGVLLGCVVLYEALWWGRVGKRDDERTER